MKDLKWIPGYEDHYKIDTSGNVYSLKPGYKQKKLASFPQVFDYDIINLSIGGKPTTFLIHQLVMNTYGPPKPYPPKDYCINHIDKNKKNNHISNLKWIKKIDVKKRPRLPVKCTGIDDGDIIKFRSVTDCCKYFHTNQSYIRRVINSDKPYKGYLFEDLITHSK